MKRALILALGLSSAAAFTTRALADDVPPPPGGELGDEGPEGPGGPGGPMGHMFKKLNLSADQKTQIEQIRQKYEGQLKSIGKQVKTERDALGQLMTEHAPQAQAQAEHTKVQGLMNQLGDTRFAMFYDISGVLTADQRTQLASLQKDMAERWKKHHRHGKDKDGNGEP